MAGSRRTKRSHIAVQTLCAYAEELKWKVGRKTAAQKTQLTHPKTGSVVYLPQAVGGRDVTNYKRLISRGAEQKL